MRHQLTKKLKQKLLGFTLVELIVTISIVGLIIAIGFISIGKVRSTANDFKRTDDIKKIQTALQTYFIDEHHYPDTLNFGEALIGETSSTTYLKVIPSNPPYKNETICSNGNYIYVPTNNSTNYTINFCIESNTGVLTYGCKAATAAGIRTAPCGIIQNGLAVWLDANDSSTLFTNSNCTGSHPTDNQTVGCWADKSAYGNNAFQSSGGVQPSLIDNQLNSKPVIRFNGSSNYLQISDDNSIDFTNAMSIFAVFKSNGADNSIAVKWYYSAQSSWGFQTTTGDPQNVTMHVALDVVDGGGNLVDATDANLNSSDFSAVALTYDGTQSTKIKIYKNSNLLSTSIGGTIPATLQNSSADLNIGFFGGGLSRYFSGDMAEIAIYNRAVTDSERQVIDNYFNDKYNIY